MVRLLSVLNGHHVKRVTRPPKVQALDTKKIYGQSQIWEGTTDSLDKCMKEREVTMIGFGVDIEHYIGSGFIMPESIRKVLQV